MSAPDRRSRFSATRPRQGGNPGGETLAIVERPATLVQLTARKGRQAELAATVEKLHGLALPESGRVAASGGKTALWLQPGSWLVTAPAGERGTLPDTLALALSGVAAVVDQSHGRCLLEITGSQARAVLARLCRLDLHERVFPVGASAATLVGHVSCLVQRMEGPVPGFGLIVGSTFSEWLLDELASAAAAHGWHFTPADEAAA